MSEDSPRYESRGQQSFLDTPSPYEGTYLEFLGFRLIDWKEGFVRLEMAVRPDHQNTIGFLHGGVIASLLDIACAFSGSYKISRERVSVTVNLNSNYMAPHQGEHVLVEGEIVRRTSSLFFAQSRLLDPDRNLLCATATGTYKTVERASVPDGA